MGVIRLGGLGAGARFGALARSAQAAGGMEFTMLSDTNPQNIERARGLLEKPVHAVSDYREMLASPEVDAVAISTPNWQHKDQVLAALDAGKHVLVEKPMATTLADARAMVEAGRKAKPVFMVGLQMRHHAWCRKVHEYVTTGRLGRVRMVWCTEWRSQFRDSKEWVFDESLSGGAIVEKNCHHFDLFNWWTGSRPTHVAAFGGLGPTPPVMHGRKNEIVDHAFMVAEYANHARGMIGVCFFGSHDVGRDIGVTGDEGTLLFSTRHRQVDFGFYPAQGDAEKIELPDCSNGNHMQMVAFRDAVLGKARPSPTPQDGYESILAPVAAELAMKEKRVVTIEEIEAGA